MTWTIKMLEELKELYKTHTARECADVMGLSFNVVKAALLNHKLGGRGHFSFWTAERIEKLIEVYPETKNSDLAIQMGCTENMVASQALKQKLRKSKEFMLRHSITGQFKPGTVPPNKGQRMSPEQYEKARHTMFKKGNVPANAKEADGVITIRKDKRGVEHKFIRVSLGKWESHSRYVWEQIHGPIPKGMCVWHKDFDTLNDDDQNLELITQKENRIRNSGHAKLSDNYIANTLAFRKSPELKAAILANGDLIEIKRLQILLNRALKEPKNDSIIK